MPSDTEGVHSSVKAIQDMEAACARFARTVVEQLPEVERELRQVTEGLEERRSDLRREIASLEDQISSAEEDEDVSSETHRVAEAEDELVAVGRRIRALGETGANYTKQARNMEHLATAHAIQAREFLTGAEEDLKACLTNDNNRSISNAQPNGVNSLDDSNKHWKSLGIENVKFVTPADVKALKCILRRNDAVTSKEQVETIEVLDACFDTAFVESVVTEYLQIVPPPIARNLPKLKILVLHPDTDHRNKPLWRGKYIVGSGQLLISNLLTQQEARSTMFHELTHWIHADGPKWYREAIERHFEQRTAGEPLVELKEGYPPGTFIKRDKWIRPYAGCVYTNDPTIPLGAEIPTVYMQHFADLPDNQLARLLNIPEFRDTMIITLRIFLTK